MDNELQRIGEKLLPSIAYGDAAGVPVETKSFNYISENYGRIDRLVPTTDNIYFKGEWPAGKTSDDTAMSVDLVKALLRADRFDPDTVAKEHVVTYLNTPEVTIIKDGVKKIKKLGYGSSTSNSLDRIIGGVSPYESGESGGNGNGIIMKMAPLVFWQYARCLSDKQRYEEYDQLTTMTHDSDVARVATRVHGDVLYNLLLEDFDATAFGYRVWDLAQFHEAQLGSTTHDVSENLEVLRDSYVPSVRVIQRRYEARMPGVSERELGKSYGFYVPETLAISYAAFAIGHGDYSQTVFTAVNLGGDADSTASISGAMVNFQKKGNIRLPGDSGKVQDMGRLKKLSREFTARALES